MAGPLMWDERAYRSCTPPMAQAHPTYPLGSRPFGGGGRGRGKDASCVTVRAEDKHQKTIWRMGEPRRKVRYKGREVPSNSNLSFCSIAKTSAC
jgi:hypothetical protein